MSSIIIIYLIVINLVTFVLYGIDKGRAKRHAWRITEATLISIAILGGSIGALAGMMVSHHKTKHLKFIIGIPVILCLQVAIIIYILY